MPRYANKTSVPVERTKQEIEALVQRYGADKFMSGWEDQRAVLGFRIENRHVRFVLVLPAQTGRPTGRASDKAAQETRSRWRALLLVIKAKLEAVSSGITTIEQEFLAHIVLPDNRTVAEALLPQLATAYRTGRMPSLLGPGSDPPGEVIDAR